MCGQALGGSQLQPRARGDPFQLCICLPRCHTVCRRGGYLFDFILIKVFLLQLVKNFIYPVGVAVSMACLTLTFLLYLLLPQLRDLTGIKETFAWFAFSLFSFCVAFLPVSLSPFSSISSCHNSEISQVLKKHSPVLPCLCSHLFLLFCLTLFQ